MTVLVFIDTEFTNFTDPKLISLGMVAESGEEFYVEVDFPERECSDFVRHVVVPLLDPHTHRLASQRAGREALSWLSSVCASGGATVCFDYQTDWDLFADAVGHHYPFGVTPRNVSRDTNELLRYEFFKKNGLKEHHALNDARALRYSFRERNA